MVAGLRSTQRPERGFITNPLRPIRLDRVAVRGHRLFLCPRERHETVRCEWIAGGLRCLRVDQLVPENLASAEAEQVRRELLDVGSLAVFTAEVRRHVLSGGIARITELSDPDLPLSGAAEGEL